MSLWFTMARFICTEWYEDSRGEISGGSERDDGGFGEWTEQNLQLTRSRTPWSNKLARKRKKKGSLADSKAKKVKSTKPSTDDDSDSEAWTRGSYENKTKEHCSTAEAASRKQDRLAKHLKIQLRAINPLPTVVRGVHEGLKAHCSFCGKEFVRPYEKNRHEENVLVFEDDADLKDSKQLAYGMGIRRSACGSEHENHSDNIKRRKDFKEQ